MPQKILELIPESLHEELFAEVAKKLKERKKEEEVKTSNEISPDMKQYLANKKTKDNE